MPAGWRKRKVEFTARLKAAGLWAQFVNTREHLKDLDFAAAEVWAELMKRFEPLLQERERGRHQAN